VSLPTSALFGNPKEMIDPADTAHKLKLVLPRLDEETVRARLGSEKQFVYLARQITPREELAINRLGIPGIYFEPTERRRYPQGRAAAQVLGGVDVDGHGVAGVERRFEERLNTDPTPLRLSIDLRVQAVVRDELGKAMDMFSAIGGCGIVMDVHTGEVLAMVSLPDYDANDFGSASADDRFNRAVTGVYEPGSTFKLQNVSLALDSGTVNIWNGFDATHPISIGRFTISDFEGKKRFLYIPEIIAYSSNIGAAHMAAAVGAERQRAWLERMGMFHRSPIELPEAANPLVPPQSNWKEIATMTIGFGHGIAVEPLQVVAGTAAIANGGTLMRSTILAQDPNGPPPVGTRVMQESTSDTVRKLMRLVVSDGFGKQADVPGYYVGGKTGTAEKISHHGYNHNSRVSAFMSAFPMQAPRYAVYMMLDEPKATAATHGYATAGWVSAPAAGRVIARIGPMLGLLPDTEHAAQINQSLYIPLEPGRPPGAKGPVAGPAPAPSSPAGPPVAAAPAKPGRPASVPAVLPLAPAGRTPAARDMRHEASLTVLPAPVDPPRVDR
jgi:cell division protein FtsI (penicillin-binding protein 3)